MKMTYKEQLIPINKYNKITKSRRCGIILYTVGFITAHDTGNPYSTAQNNVDYFCRTYKDDSASAHIFVDDKECIVCIPAFLNAERAHHVLYNKTKDNELFGDDANDMSIGVECCYFPNDKIRTLKAYNNYINSIVDLMEFHKINPTELTEHETLDSNKSDPSNMLKIIGKTLGGFEMDVENEYAKRQEPAVSEWAKDAWLSMVENGITDGLRPKENMTREENWVMLDRLYKLITENYQQSIKL